MAGKRGKGLLAGKTTASKDKDKKRPISRSARAGLQEIITPMRSPTKSSKSESRRCHHCHKTSAHVLTCSVKLPKKDNQYTFKSKICAKSYCHYCLREFYNFEEKELENPDSWICFCCRNKCLNKPCRLRRVVDLEEDKEEEQGEEEEEEKEKEEEAATFEKVAAEKDAVLKREEDYIAAIKSLEKELVFLKRELQRSEDACSSLLLQFEIQSESYRDLSSVIKQLKDLGMEKDAMKKKLLPEKSKEDHVEKEDTTIDEETVVEESLHDHSSGVEAEAVREEQDRRVYDLQARLHEAENQVEYFRNASLKESSELRQEILKRQQTYSQEILSCKCGLITLIKMEVG